MKLIIINSFGPMGSSVLASALEKFGFINFPIRKIGFHDYLMNKRSLEDPYLKNRILTLLNKYSELSKLGGINVLDRDNNKKIIRIDKKKILHQVEDYQKKKYNNLSNLFFDSYSLFNQGVCYKKNINNQKGIIELGHNLHKYDLEKLSQKYYENFDQVYFISIKRNFYDWLNAFSSQNYSRIYRIKKSFFSNIILSRIKKEYDNYISSLNQINGITINFEEIFLPNTNVTINKICQYIEISSNFNIQSWKNETFDVYGSIIKFDKVFKQVDNQIDYLPKQFKKIYNFINNLKASSKYFKFIFLDLFYVFFYFFGLLRYGKLANEKKKYL